MNDPTLSPTHPVNQIPSELLTLGTSRFEAKLTSVQRCEILALRMSKMSVGAVAVTFGVNRRTVTHIANEESNKYQSVRKLRDQMGHEAFVTKYVTEDLIDRVKAAALTREAQESYTEYDQEQPTRSGVANKRATKSSGVTMHRGPNHAFTHRIEIGWVENTEGFPDGWYFKLLDVDGPEATEWSGTGNEADHATSGTALAAARNYLNENY